MKIATMKNCGCEIRFDDLLKINNVARCPNHSKNGIAHVAADCESGCGKIVIRTNGPYAIIKCKECLKKEKREKDMAYKKVNAHRRKLHDSKQYKQKKLAINPHFDASLYAKGLSIYLPQGKSI